MNKNTANRYNLLAITSQFDDYLHSKNLSKISRKNYLSDLRMFLSWMNAQEDVLDFSINTIIVYKQFLQNSRLPARSINRSLSSIRAYGDLLVQIQEEFSNPARLVANVPVTTSFRQNQLIKEFARSNDLSQDDSQALYEFLKLSHEHT